MEWRTVAIAVFLDENSNVIVQDRRGVAKVGERYGFWGGQTKKGETPKQTIKRELQEELGFVPRRLDYWDKFTFTIQEQGPHKGDTVGFHVFLSPITPKLENAEVMEGKGLLKMKMEQVIKGKGFPGGSTKFLKKLKDFKQKV